MILSIDNIMIGGDEFVILLTGEDYDNREELLNRIRKQVGQNLDSGEGVIIACGMSEYNRMADSRKEVHNEGSF